MTDKQLYELVNKLAFDVEMRRKLGGYNADATFITSLTETSLSLTKEILALRQEIRKLKQQ